MWSDNEYKTRRNILCRFKSGGRLWTGGNKARATVIAAAITSQHEKSRLPTHIDISAACCGLSKDSVVLLEQVRTIDKQRLKEKMGTIDSGDMNRVDKALSVSFGLGTFS